MATETQNKDKTYWHDAFFEALQLELHQYLEALKFVYEHQLGKQALIVDVHYNKVMGYAYLYASSSHAHVSDITISFAVTVHPRNLLNYLEHDRKFKVTLSDDGICWIDGEGFLPMYNMKQ